MAKDCYFVFVIDHAILEVMGRVCRTSELLYLEGPEKRRYVMKYRHQNGKSVVKITDDSVCLMYLADQAQDVKKVDKLTSQLMSNMSSKEK